MHQGDLNLADSGEVLRGKTSDSRLAQPPLLDSLLGKYIGNEAHLLGHSMVSGTTCSNDPRDRRI
jgi:hypothetical protein